MTTTPPIKRAKLRTTIPSFGSVQVDEDKGTIRNAAVMTVGPAQGHGFEIDRKSLEQLVEAANGVGGEIKMRYRHPSNPNDEDLGTDVGVLKNLRIVGDQVRGDVQLHEYAKSLPGIGNVWDYLIGKAKQAPSSFGLSAVIAYELETVLEGKLARMFARISGVDAVDFVGRPAANPRGLLSKQPRKKSNMSYESTYRPALEAMGLKSDASDEQAAAFFDALDPDKQSEIAGAESEPAKMSAKLSDTEFVKLEQKRVKTIMSLGVGFPQGIVPESLLVSLAASGATLEQANKAVLKHIEDESAHCRFKPGTSISVGENRATKGVVESCAMALLARAGVLSRDAKLDDRTRRLADQPATETGRALLSAVGIDARNMNRGQLAKVLMSPRTALNGSDYGRWASLSQTSSDFDNLMSTAASLALKTGYNEAPVSWPQWCKRGTFSDFTSQERAVLSNIATPPEVHEGAEYTNANLSDGKETFTPKKYGSIVQLTWEAIVNDRLDAFLQITAKHGAAARRLEDDLAYAVLTANAALSDTIALFHDASHGNLTSGTDAPTVATLGVNRGKMMKQTGPNGGYLNIKPAFLLVPPELLTTSEQLVASLVDPSKSNDTTNPFRNLSVIGEARLNHATRWYLAADPRQIDTVEVAFLESEPAPVLERDEGFRTDETSFKVRHVCVAKALEYRGLLRNGS